MTSRIQNDLELLRDSVGCSVDAQALPSGAHLITISNFPLGPGWNREVGTVLFVAPPAFPAAQPDCFWVEPTGLRLANGATPQSSNDSNPIPEVGNRGTWFSWHLQHWNASRDSLLTFFKVITKRLQPAR
jgi:hypothetical protein